MAATAESDDGDGADEYLPVSAAGDGEPGGPRQARGCVGEGRHGLVGAGETVGRLPCKAAQDRRLPTIVQIGQVDSRRRRRLLEPLHRGLERGVGHERPRPGDHLEEDDPHRIDVGRRRHRAALDLLRRHVGGGARNLTGIVQGDGETRPVVLRVALGQAEVRDDGPQLPVRRGGLHEHDVEALEVAVHDTGTMRGGEAGRHLPRQRQGFLGGEPSVALELVGEGLAVQQLHRQDDDLGFFPFGAGRASRLMPKHVEDPADVRMGHLPGQVHLALEHLDGALVGDLRQDRLERDALVELRVLRFVELAHPSLGEKADDAEAGSHDFARAEHGAGWIGAGLGARGDARLSLDPSVGRLVVFRRGRRRYLAHYRPVYAWRFTGR